MRWVKEPLRARGATSTFVRGSLFNRSQIMFMLGLVLIAVGMTVALAVRVLSFSRYLHLEDLGLDVNPAVGAKLFRELVAPTGPERAFFYVSVALVPIGIMLLFLGWRRRTPADL